MGCGEAQSGLDIRRLGQAQAGCLGVLVVFFGGGEGERAGGVWGKDGM